MALPFGVSGILSLAVSQVYLPTGSLYSFPLLVLGLFLVVISIVFLFFFFSARSRDRLESELEYWKIPA
jgi:hypothetical protein